MRTRKNYILAFLGTLYLLFAQQLNAQIAPPVLNRVNIVPATQNVYFSWQASATPGVTHYIVYKLRYTGNNPIPSLDPVSPNLNALEYTYADAEVQAHSVGYTVKAFIVDVSSDDSNLDSTIYLSVTYDSCTASAYLKWNDYNSWRGNILRYEVHMGRGGIMQAPIVVDPSQTEITLYTLTANETYNFYVSAHKDSGNPDDISNSNRVVVPTMHSFYPEYIYANYGTVDAGNHPQIQFTIDPNSELVNYVLFRSETNDNFTDSITFFSTQEKIIAFTDNVDAAQKAYYYQLVAVNNCGSYLRFSDNIAGTINLTAALNGYAINLNWNSYDRWIGGVDHYEIQRMFRGESFETITETANLQYTDNTLESVPNQSYANEVCYRVIAHERPGNPYTTNLESSTSVLACVQLPPALSFNNVDAFIPGHDIAGSFGPDMEFLPDAFNFKIYNRWGNLVFETTDAENPDWDGKIGNGAFAPEGVYRYQLQYSNELGEMIVLHGNVTLVRQ